MLKQNHLRNQFVAAATFFRSKSCFLFNFYWLY